MKFDCIPNDSTQILTMSTSFFFPRTPITFNPFPLNPHGIHGLSKNNGCHNYLYKRDAPRLLVSSQCQESATCKYMVSVIGYARQNMQNNVGMFVGNNQHFASWNAGATGYCTEIMLLLG